MRKTRLVILPTKCLHQMGFLLLFLSCPVIGDWGRIRPDNENLQKAIEVEREGTCGLQRDTPGGFLDVTNVKGSDIRRYREDNDLDTRRLSRFDERRDMRRLARNPERRVESRRERSIQSRSLEPRRNDIRVRSLSLSRLEATRRQTREADTERRDGERRLSLTRRESERRVERQDERTARQNERIRSPQRRENDRSVQRLSLHRREDEMRRNVREEPERRLSLSRMEDERRIQQSENRRVIVERRNSRNDIGNERERENIRREVDTRRLVVKSENVRDERRMDVANRRVERLEKIRRMSTNTNHHAYLEDKQEGFLTGAVKWLNLEKYETGMIGDWSTNCVIGAVAYYLTTRQTKTV